MIFYPKIVCFRIVRDIIHGTTFIRFATSFAILIRNHRDFIFTAVFYRRDIRPHSVRVITVAIGAVIESNRKIVFLGSRCIRSECARIESVFFVYGFRLRRRDIIARLVFSCTPRSNGLRFCCRQQADLFRLLVNQNEAMYLQAFRFRLIRGQKHLFVNIFDRDGYGVLIFLCDGSYIAALFHIPCDGVSVLVFGRQVKCLIPAAQNFHIRKGDIRELVLVRLVNGNRIERVVLEDIGIVYRHITRGAVRGVINRQIFRNVLGVLYKRNAELVASFRLLWHLAIL